MASAASMFAMIVSKPASVIGCRLFRKASGLSGAIWIGTGRSEPAVLTCIRPIAPSAA